MNQVIPIDATITLSLLKLYELTTISGLEKISAIHLSGSIGHGVSPAFVSVAVRQMLELGWISADHPANAHWKVTLTPAGAREAEKQLRDPDSLAFRYQREGMEALQSSVVDVGAVPASNRLVSRSHNRESFDALDSSLESIEKALCESNEAGEIFGDEKSIALEEISSLRKIINSTSVRALTVIQYARVTLSWIAEKAGAAAVGELAKKALVAAFAWIAQ